MGEAVEEGAIGFTLLAFCEHNEMMHSIIVTAETTLAVMISSLVAKGLSFEGGMMLYYTHPTENFPVGIRSDNDIGHMLRVHEVLKKSLCKMSVKFEDAPEKRRRMEDGYVGERSSRYFTYTCSCIHVMNLYLRYTEIRE